MINRYQAETETVIIKDSDTGHHLAPPAVAKRLNDLENLVAELRKDKGSALSQMREYAVDNKQYEKDNKEYRERNEWLERQVIDTDNLKIRYNQTVNSLQDQNKMLRNTINDARELQENPPMFIPVGAERVEQAICDLARQMYKDVARADCPDSATDADLEKIFDCTWLAKFNEAMEVFT